MWQSGTRESERGERIVSDSGEKNVTKRMWLWWWAGGPVATYGADMAGSNTSKVEARRRVREAQARDQVRAEANRKRVDHRAEAAAAIARMQQRGETLAMIAELTGASVGEIRALLRHAPRPESPLRALLRVH